MDKYRFLSTILYNIGGIFHTQYRLTGNGCYRRTPNNTYKGHIKIKIFYYDQ